MKSNNAQFPLVTAQNQADLVSKALNVVPARHRGQIPLLAAKAVEFSKEFDKLDREVLNEHDDQFMDWSRVIQSPRVKQFERLIETRKHLEGQTTLLRRGAAAKLAQHEIRFITSDVESLEALQSAILANVPYDQRIREELHLNPADTGHSVFASGLREASPIIFGALSADGLSHVLSHRSLLDSLGDPRTPLVMAIAGGFAYMTFWTAQSFGRRLGLTKLRGSFKENLGQVAGLLLGAFAVLIPSAGLAGFDVIAVLSEANSHEGMAPALQAYVPLVVLAFTASGVVAKIMQGYQEGSEARADQSIRAEQSRIHDSLLMLAKDAIELVAEADSKEGELEELHGSILDMEDELKELGFEARIPEELLDKWGDAQMRWQKASEDFWRLAHRRQSVFERIGEAIDWLRNRRKQPRNSASANQV